MSNTSANNTLDGGGRRLEQVATLQILANNTQPGVQTTMDQEAESDNEYSPTICIARFKLMLEAEKKRLDNLKLNLEHDDQTLMAMWNLHMLQFKFFLYFIDAKGPQILQACVGFVKNYGGYIQKENLERNLYLHLKNLHDNGLLDADDVRGLIKLLRSKHDNQPVKVQT